MLKKIPKVPRAAERLRIARLMVAMTEKAHATIFGPDSNFGANVDAVFVVIAVLIGHAEGRAMSPTKIAHYLGMSRTTVLRKLAQLERLKIVERIGARYYVTAEKLADDDSAITTLNNLIINAKL